MLVERLLVLLGLPLLSLLAEGRVEAEAKTVAVADNNSH